MFFNALFLEGWGFLHSFDVLFYINNLKKQIAMKKINCSLTIEAAELAPGMYIYSLIADGKEVDSKRMIVTE